LLGWRIHQHQRGGVDVGPRFTPSVPIQPEGSPSMRSSTSPPKSSRGTDYVLGVKDNQPGLAEAANHTPARWIGPSRTTSRSKRITGGSKPRRCLATNDVAWLQEQHQHWTGLRSLVMIESTREIIGKKRRRHG